MSTYLRIKRNDFPEIASNLADIGEEFQHDAAVFFQGRVREQLYPGHGYDTGRMSREIGVFGNVVRGQAPYTGFVNNGWAHFAGYHFWEQAEEDTRQWMRDELLHRIARGLS